MARLTARGVDIVARAAVIFDGLRADWARDLGRERLAEFEADLRTIAPAERTRLDLVGWLAP